MTKQSTCEGFNPGDYDIVPNNRDSSMTACSYSFTSKNRSVNVLSLFILSFTSIFNTYFPGTSFEMSISRGTFSSGIVPEYE